MNHSNIKTSCTIIYAQTRKMIYSDTDYLKYSNRYYIYTLAHILI